MSDSESITESIDWILRGDVFAAVLPDTDFGVDEDLFEGGVDSLHLLRLVARTNTVFAVAVDADDFFQRRTRSALGRQVAERLYGSGETPPVDSTVGNIVEV